MWIAVDTSRAIAPCQRDCGDNPNRSADRRDAHCPRARHRPCSLLPAVSPGRLRCPEPGRESGAIRDDAAWRAIMKQASSRELFGYWAARRGTKSAPERGEIEPSAIRRALGDVFILEFDRQDGHPFRLAGTRVCALFGRELKNEQFLNLWDPPSRLGLATCSTSWRMKRRVWSPP